MSKEAEYRPGLVPRKVTFYKGNPRRGRTNAADRGTWCLRAAEGLERTAEVFFSCPRCGRWGSFLDGEGGRFKLVGDDGNVFPVLTCGGSDCGFAASMYLKDWNPRNDWKT